MSLSMKLAVLLGMALPACATTGENAPNPSRHLASGHDSAAAVTPAREPGTATEPVQRPRSERVIEIASSPAVDNGPKIVEIDLETDRVVRVYRLDRALAPANSYLNDVRVDSEYAYVSESGTGSLIVIHRATGKARKVLAAHPSTKANPSIVPRPEGRELRNAAGEVALIHADQIELSPDGTWLYFQPASGQIASSIASSSSWSGIRA